MSEIIVDHNHNAPCLLCCKEIQSLRDALKEARDLINELHDGYDTEGLNPYGDQVDERVKSTLTKISAMIGEGRK